jgi:L-threonylcarbamoyladenylate synthase
MTDEILKSYEVLKKGGIIVYPTDTVWGIGCDATDFKAVNKIYEIKKRNTQKNFIVLIDNKEKLTKYVEKIPPFAWDLIDNWNKPLTIVYPGAKNVAKNIIADDGSIAIRVIRDEFCRQLINMLDKPLVSTSANISGENVPVVFRDIPESILLKADYVVNLNREKMIQAKPSTIIKFNETGEFYVIRE